MEDFGAVLFHGFHRLYARAEQCAHAQKCTRMLRTSYLQHFKSLPLSLQKLAGKTLRASTILIYPCALFHLRKR